MNEWNKLLTHICPQASDYLLWGCQCRAAWLGRIEQVHHGHQKPYHTRLFTRYGQATLHINCWYCKHAPAFKASREIFKWCQHFDITITFSGLQTNTFVPLLVSTFHWTPKPLRKCYLEFNSNTVQLSKLNQTIQNSDSKYSYLLTNWGQMYEIRFPYQLLNSS